ncbi:hypothetical protein HPB52_022375 [Rhipicephalus sanguineus]|uniref:Cadherin domain-containing protein n=1 Tax=Rhipicephalus sanguineus TaxID=34632 RepID=A0A9D4T4J8_RHISA|nr:hypothetical protein HPB52_022375 [Rhipicephalus sanguineus]
MGVVTVSSVPPAWPPAGFELNVSVTDGVYQSYTQLRLVVRASNEHSPQFSQTVYEAVVAENLPAGARVAQVSATDPDQGVLGQLTYAIRSRHCALHFRINSTTGELVTQEPLDHERRHLYEIPVSATDGGGRLAFAVVRVAVTDVNDNEPTFGAAEYEVSIWTNTSVGTTLLKASNSMDCCDTEGKTNAWEACGIRSPLKGMLVRKVVSDAKSNSAHSEKKRDVYQPKSARKNQKQQAGGAVGAESGGNCACATESADCRYCRVQNHGAGWHSRRRVADLVARDIVR